MASRKLSGEACTSFALCHVFVAWKNLPNDLSLEKQSFFTDPGSSAMNHE